VDSNAWSLVEANRQIALGLDALGHVDNRGAWFARDSLLEGTGFELSVPPGLGRLRAGTVTVNQYSEPRNGRSFYGGTNSSNPLPSSRESATNRAGPIG
jgi:hypothetical protein